MATFPQETQLSLKELPRRDQVILKIVAEQLKKLKEEIYRIPPQVINKVPTPEVYNNVTVPEVKVHLDTKAFDEAITHQAAVMYDLINKAMELVKASVEDSTLRVEQIIKSLEGHKIEFNPIVTVPEPKTSEGSDLRPLILEIRQLIGALKNPPSPIHPVRRFTITHDDGTQSIIEESSELESLEEED